jgi:hypothetical protein
MRTFTRITAATVLTAGLAVTGVGTALAAPSQDDSRPGGVLGLLLGEWPFEGDSAPAADSGTQEAPAAPAEQDTNTGDTTGTA